MGKLTKAQAIRNAIGAEEAAARFYQTLANTMDDADVRSFFESMEKMESEHARAIDEKAKAMGVLDMPEQAEAHVEMVETAPGWVYQADLTLDQAVAVAIESENHAALYYDAMSGFFDGELAEFFTQMARTEEQHAVMLRDKMQKTVDG
jgi:rubrerythrin